MLFQILSLCHAFVYMYVFLVFHFLDIHKFTLKKEVCIKGQCECHKNEHKIVCLHVNTYLYLLGRKMNDKIGFTRVYILLISR